MIERECETSEAGDGRGGQEERDERGEVTVVATEQGRKTEKLSPARDGSREDYDAAKEEDPETEDGGPRGAICTDLYLLEGYLKENLKIQYDLLSSMPVDQTGTTRLTIEGGRFTVLAMFQDSDLDVLFHGTDEGGYRGYSVVMSKCKEELFLWHTVEIVPVNSDGTLTFPDKVQEPSLSLASLIKFADNAHASFDCDNSQTHQRVARRLNNNSQTVFHCKYSLTRQRVPQRLYQEVIKALINRQRYKLLPEDTVKICDHYAVQDEKPGFERYLDTGLFVDWEDQHFRREVAERLEKREGKRKAEQEDESSGGKKNKTGISSR